MAVVASQAEAVATVVAVASQAEAAAVVAAVASQEEDTDKR